MKALRISDTTLRESKANLSFRKICDIAALLDSLRLSVIELGEYNGSTEKRLLLKTMASTVTSSVLAVSVGIDDTLAAAAIDCLRGAPHPRLQVSASFSTARMEYMYGKNKKNMLAAVLAAVESCRGVCEDVELRIEDATRADFSFLTTVIAAALEAGAGTVCVCDTAGSALPDELAAFLNRLQKELPALESVTLAVDCNNALGLADACTAAALRCGCGEVKVSACNAGSASLLGIVRIIDSKVGAFPLQPGVEKEKLAHAVKVITNLCNLSSDEKTPFEYGVREEREDISFTEQDSPEAISREIQKLGYILSDEDSEKVYSAFKRIVSKKDRIDLHELEVIVASEALQVPQTYKLENSIITTGSKCDAVAHIKLKRKGEELDGVSLGNGAVDASFLAIEKITGCHYELDDFQLQAITEGKEAMGQTLVKLRSKGKVYSGKGVSTDIVMSAIEAYLNALNKIVYEEERA